MSKLNKKIAVIILNYNNAKDTVECVNSFLNNSDNYQLYIVDNDSSDDSFSIIKNTFKDSCIYISSKKNLGYAGGNNLGIYKAVQDGFEYICIANNDIIVENSTIDILVSYLENNNDVGIVGPAIMDYYERDKVQSTGGYVNLNTGNVSNINCNVKYSNINSSVIIPDYVGGACILFKRGIVDVVGALPESYFLFFEETEWCLRIKRHGLKVVCVPQAKVYHKGSATIKTKQGLSEYLLERNRIRFVIRNGNKIQMIFTIASRVSVAVIKGLLRNKHYFGYLKYIQHGICNKIDPKYDYIWIDYDA